MLQKLDLDKTYQYLLIFLAFLIPLTVAGANTVIVFICLLWLLTGNYNTKFKQIISNKLIIVSILFYLFHIIGMLWTEDINWGLHMLHKMWYFIGLFPILFTIVKKDKIKYYISAFLLAISFTEVCSYLVWFEIIEPFKNASVENPTPFMSHISYNPILAFAIYIVLHEIFFNKKMTNLFFFFYSFFAISMTVNMFITGGRAGQVVFFIILLILSFQIFDKERFKALLLISIVVPSIFLASYQFSDLFKERVDLAVMETLSLSDESNNSIGLRVNFNKNSFEMIKNNLLLGVGTGDFPKEYEKINKVNTPSLPNSTNPHNMFTLVLSQLGVIGLFSLLSIFYYQIKLSYISSNKFIRDAGFTLPIMFLIMMLSDSYLLGHYTTLMFVFFSSFLYKNFEDS
jgi:O-antigen ligase